MADTRTTPEWRVVYADEEATTTASSVPSVVAGVPRQRSAESAVIPRPRTPDLEVIPRPRPSDWGVVKPSKSAGGTLASYVAAVTEPRHHKKLLAIGGLLSLCVAAAGAAVVATSSPSGAISGRVDLHGTFMINPRTATAARNFTATADGSCAGSGQYAGLTAGAPVVIRDPVGRVIATSMLGAGQDLGIGGCVFSWRVPNVPNERTYGVGIGQLDIVTFAKTKVQGGFDTAIGH